NQNVTFRYHRVGEGDLIINEVLYYPSVGMKRYVEIVNNSGSDIFLFGLILSGYTASGDLLRSCIVDGYAMLADGEFAVITADTANVALNYNAKGLLLEASRFPSLNTSKGYISLRSADGVVLDSMYYDNQMHSSLLANKRGVALERISVGAPSLDSDNWTSASEQFGFATPGFINSCAKESENDDNGDDVDLPNQAVTIENQLMRPGDSDKEFTMTFNFNRPTDPMLSVTVYDSDGRRMRCIADEVMAYPGFSVAWDGRDSHGSYCKSGIYVVLIKAVDDSGWSFEKKEACVIGKFR
ncbi:MAG: lamin tail domain-containing protein, partial [Bacteroidales bacterium]|nr:lamin tail domain-containing protein [Bacteroidales bacterium]